MTTNGLEDDGRFIVQRRGRKQRDRAVEAHLRQRADTRRRAEDTRGNPRARALQAQ